jgi:oligosaccharide repeat unit polymerase
MIDNLNDYYIIFFTINTLIFAFGFYVLNKLGGIKDNFPFFISIATYLIYVHITPTYYFYTQESYIHRINIYDYYGGGILVYGLAILLFILGYLPFKPVKRLENQKSVFFQPRITIVVIFVLFFGLTLLDVIINGANIFAILTGQSDVFLGDASSTNYLKAFSDSVIIAVWLAYFFNVRRPIFLVFLFLALALFLFLAFRYRIILTFFGLFGIYVYKKGLPVKRVLQLSLVAFIGLYFMLFITINRWLIAYGAYDELVYNPQEFEYELIFQQTRGFLAELALLRHYDIREVENDYGLSMFGYIFVRAIPKEFFPNGKKPYPIPALKISIDSLQPDKFAKKYGEALLNLGHFYISFGWFGLYFMSFLLGFILKRLKFYTLKNYSKDVAFLISLIIGGGLFQFITRGYFPQVVQNYVYLFIPLILFFQLTKRKFVIFR